MEMKIEVVREKNISGNFLVCVWVWVVKTFSSENPLNPSCNKLFHMHEFCFILQARALPPSEKKVEARVCM
jgi:hypothetical protein